MLRFCKQIMSVAAFLLAATGISFSQNALNIPPALTGTVFNLNVQSGTQTFYGSTATPTYGINGAWMAPTIIVNKGDSITLNVINNLNTFTTIHWHGLHVAPENDGGPHQIINVNSTWSPSFKVRNDAATYWYHPHGNNKTDLHVSKGLAGMFIVKDSAEAAIVLPRTYGVDDFPVIIQSKAFDVLKQIAIATEDDTALFVNGTLHPYLDAPAQVIRLRLLNGSSMRSYYLGFTANQSFKIIGSDDGLLDTAITATRIRISPGERYEILLDLQGMTNQNVFLKNFGSELPNGIYGAATVGIGADTIPYYSNNFLNGADYDILQLNVVPQTASPVTTIPTLLVPNTTWDSALVNTTRTFYLEANGLNQKAEGPFNINGNQFDMNVVNVITYKNNIEIWEWVNNTLVAHPIHIHGVHFYILSINGNPPPSFEADKKDVVLVMPGDTVKFITQFEDFANDSIPYMYHCHMLHDEDDGMMGSFVVLDTTDAEIAEIKQDFFNLKVFPNPSNNSWNIEGNTTDRKLNVQVFNVLGKMIKEEKYFLTDDHFSFNIHCSIFPSGVYFLKIKNQKLVQTIRIIKI